MISVNSVDPKTGKVLYVENTWQVLGNQSRGTEALPVFISAYHNFGKFTTKTISGAATTVITTPDDNGSLILTDLIISSNKVNTGTINVRFNDGSNTAIIVAPNTTDAPVNLAINFGGRWQGWRDAYIDVVTAQAGQSVNIGLGYIKAVDGIPYDEWDNLR